jgi:hypothetical protein
VKIYAHRVDDTYNASHRILESLSRNGNRSSYEDEEEGEDDGNKENDGENKEGTKTKTRRPKQATECQTIEKNPTALNALKLENEYTFDPLFQKISKAFDEGGAKGMLLYNMRVSTSCCSLYFPEKSLAKDMTKNQQENMAFNKSQTHLVNMKDLVKRSGLTKEKVASLSICSQLSNYREALQYPKTQIGLTLTDEQMIPFQTGGSSYSQSSSQPFQHQQQEKSFENDFAVDDIPMGATDYYDDMGDVGGFDDFGATTNDEDGNGGSGVDRQSSGSSLEVPAVKKASTTDDEHDEEMEQIATRLPWLVNREDIQRNQEEVIKPILESFNHLQLNKHNEYDYFTIDELNSSSNAWAGAKHWKYACRKQQQQQQKTGGVSAVPSLDDGSSLATGSTTVQDVEGAVGAKKKSASVKSKAKALSSMTTGLKFTLEKVEESTFGKVSTAKRSTDSTLLTKNAIAKMKSEAKDTLLPKDEKLKVSDLSRLYLLSDYSLTKTSVSGPSSPSNEIQGHSSVTGNNSTQFHFSEGANNNNYNDYQDDYYGGEGGGADYDYPPAASDLPPVVEMPEKPVKIFEGLDIDHDNLVQATRKVDKIDIK